MENNNLVLKLVVIIYKKKNGEYHKIFYNLYLEEDLPEIILWETSPDIRKALTMEELGT